VVLPTQKANGDTSYVTLLHNEVHKVGAKEVYFLHDTGLK
jgi:hypothetical protein